MQSEGQGARAGRYHRFERRIPGLRSGQGRQEGNFLFGRLDLLLFLFAIHLFDGTIRQRLCRPFFGGSRFGHGRRFLRLQFLQLNRSLRLRWLHLSAGIGTRRSIFIEVPTGHGFHGGVYPLGVIGR